MSSYPHPDSSPILSQFNYLPLDSEGWSILTPSADSRLIYVDEIAGNNATAVNYTPATLPNANDWEDPGAVLAYQDFVTAASNRREGYPDWVLCKRGGTFTFGGKINLPGGRSVTERSVLTAYGSGTVRPSFNPSAGDSLIRIWGDGCFNQVIKGIEIYPTWCDPSHGDWNELTGFIDRPDGISIYNGPDGGSGLLIEDNYIAHCKHNIRAFADDIAGNHSHTDLIIRRNHIEYSKGQGIISNSSSLLIEENTFYHNGWWDQVGTGDVEGQATIFDHSIYLPHSNNVLIRNNVTVDPSSIHIKLTSNTTVTDTINVEEVIIHDNFFIGGEIAQSLGGNDDQNDGPRWRNMRSTWNCMTELGIQRPTLRRLGWGIDAQDWEGGLVGGNIFHRYGDVEVTQATAIGIFGHSSSVDVTSNTIYKIGSPTGTNQNSYQALGTVKHEGEMTNVLFSKNLVQLPDTDLMPIGQHEALTGVTFMDNKYHSNEVTSNWFEYDGVSMDLATWQANTGDTSTATQVTFIDEARTYLTYLTSIGATSTRQNFIDLMRNRGSGVWDAQLEARYINAHIRAGLTPV